MEKIINSFLIIIVFSSAYLTIDSLTTFNNVISKQTKTVTLALN